MDVIRYITANNLHSRAIRRIDCDQACPDEPMGETRCYAGVGIVEAKPPFSATRQTVHLGRN